MHSLKQIMFKILAGYDFMLVRYVGEHELYFSIQYFTVISDVRDSKKCHDPPILSKLDRS